MPRTRRTAEALPSLSGMRLALNVHLDVKLMPIIEGLIDRDADLHVTTCSVATVRGDVADLLREAGATVIGEENMSEASWAASLDAALDWEPTHTCEMGAALTVRAHQRAVPSLRAGEEVTGSGLFELEALELRYPVIDVDSVPVKTDLHNRHTVGSSAWHTFSELTHLVLHELAVVVVGYGPVGQGVAHAARSGGGTVTVCERDPARVLAATYEGFSVRDLPDALPGADVVVTATGADDVITAEHIARLEPGCFLMNVGHRGSEIDIGALYRHDHEQILPGVTAVELEVGTVYVLADGAMVNLAAGWGDALNTFDLTSAIILAGIGALPDAERLPPGLHPLAERHWQPVLERPTT